MGKIYMVQVRDEKIIKKGKQALIIPMSIDEKGLTKEQLAQVFYRDARKLYPDLVGDKSVITIIPMTNKEYEEYSKTGIFKRSAYMGSK